MPPAIKTAIAGTAALVMIAAAWPAALCATAATDQPAQDQLAAGLWEVTAKIDVLEIPGLPKGMVDKMARDPKAAEARPHCLAAADTARPPESLFHRLGGECRYTSWSLRDGRIEATLSCTPPGGAPGTARMTLSGTYAAGEFDAASIVDAYDADGNLQMHMASRLEARRTGGCS